MKKIAVSTLLLGLALSTLHAMPITPNLIPDEVKTLTLENFGVVKFTPYDDGTDRRALRLYLEKDGDRVYTFPELAANEQWWFDNLDETFFADLNRDGKKDLVVIASYVTGIGPTGMEPFKVIAVYFQKGMVFVSDPKLDEDLNSPANYTKLNTAREVEAYLAARKQK